MIKREKYLKPLEVIFGYENKQINHRRIIYQEYLRKLRDVIHSKCLLVQKKFGSL